MIIRSDARLANQLRPVRVTPNFQRAATGSCLFELGNTRVVCSVMIDDSVPSFLKGSGKGWLTAEYNMLPASSTQRIQRERFKVGGRTHEIQRLIGRTLRTAVNMNALGERSMLIDCDVIDADGGTRTASITGAYIALALATKKLGLNVLKDPVAAVSVGMVRGTPCLDLHYDDDKAAEVDMNVVMNSKGQFIEIQGTAESAPFDRAQHDQLLQLAEKGIRELFEQQQKVLAG